jgi:hypothetical protein
MQNLDSVRMLIDVLRQAIEKTVSKRAKPRLLLLLDAIDGELRMSTGVDDSAGSSAAFG